MLRITIAAARKNAKLTQLDVANNLNVTRQTVINWESGKTKPDAGEYKKLAKLYNMPMNFLALPGEITEDINEEKSSVAIVPLSDSALSIS